MRRMSSRVLAVLAITAVAALGADNSIGTWKVNVAKSKYTPAPFPVKSLTSVREAAPDGVKVTNTGERDGSSINPATPQNTTARGLRSRARGRRMTAFRSNR